MNQTPNSQLLGAAKQADAERVYHLIHEKGANPNCHRQDDGATPLHLATERGHLEVVRMLLDAGADVTARDNYANQPLHFAAFRRHPKIVHALARAPGFEINPVNAHGATPLASATHDDDKPACLKAILDLGGDPFTTHPCPETGEETSPHAFAVANESHRTIALFEAYRHFSPPELKPGLDRATALASLEYPAGWQRFEPLCVFLEQQGEPIGKADLLSHAQSAGNYLIRAAECGQLLPALTYLQKRGEPLTTGDLLDAGGKPTALYSAITRCQALPDVLRGELWQSRPVGEAKALLAAIPDEEKSQLKNPHAFLAAVARGNYQGMVR